MKAAGIKAFVQNLRSQLDRGIGYQRAFGWKAFVSRLKRPSLWTQRKEVHLSNMDQQYDGWLSRNTPSQADLSALAEASLGFSLRPTVSIVMPVYNTEGEFLRAAIESVRHQVYGEWELCIADDASRRSETKMVLAEYAHSDPRIKVSYLARNSGTTGASNAALALATGEFVGFLDHDDELKPDALYRVVELLNSRPDLDYIYTDEDKKAQDGTLVDVFFKPDWSPDLLLCCNYVTHFSVYRRSLLESLGGFRPGYDGSQDYDLVLRATEQTDRIGHIPLPLYTWRKTRGSAALKVDAKPYALEAAKRAIADAMRRRGRDATVEDGLVFGGYRVHYAIAGNPRVAIIIPTRDRIDLLKPCIESVEAISSYPNYEIVVVDNGSENPETLAYLGSLPWKVVRDPGDFNFPRICNEGARAAEDAEYFIFLNNDTKVISRGWIEAMVEQGQHDEVGAVGARLLYEDGRPQHEGVISSSPHVNIAATPAHLDWSGYHSLDVRVRDCSAVTAACLLMKASRFWELGGFDEEMAVIYNDVDLCLRAREKGYWIIYTPYAKLYHLESQSRGRVHNAHDDALFRKRWAHLLAEPDPYFNVNLKHWWPVAIGD